MSPLNSTISEHTESYDMYQSLKGRLRKPSAKMLESISSPEKPLVAASAVPAPKAVATPIAISKPSYLVLQSAVAEVMFSDPTESSEAPIIRDSAVTVESIPSAEWRMYGWAWQEKVKAAARSARKPTVTRKASESTAAGPSPVAKKAVPVKVKPTIKVDESVPEEKLEDEPLDQADDHSIVAKSETNEHHGDEDSQSDSGSPEEARLASPAEGGVKRKRGRPFKGQEKPIEERLMIETSKIRRLIDDIMRKGNADSEYCLRLRNIARDLDEVMAMNILLVSGGSPANGPTEDQPMTGETLPETIDSILPPQEPAAPEGPSVIENL